MSLPDLSRYEQYETLTQARVRYYEAGSGENLLLLHGMGMQTSADTYRSLFEPLAERYRVIALDVPGFGKSDRKLAYGPTFDVIVDGIREFMDRKSIERTSIVGHSAGCWFSGILAYESPNRVEKIVWMGAAGMNVEPIAAVATARTPDLESLTEAALDSVYEGSEFSEAEAREMAAILLDTLEQPGGRDGMQPLFAQMQNPDSRKSYLLQRRLPYIPHPTLVVWGEKEFMEPHPTWTAEWESSGHDPGKGSKPWVTPDSRFEMVPGATHNLHWERPSLILNLITRFIG